jgi:hypothetical protein
MTGATSAAGSAYPSGAPEFTTVLSGVRVTRSLILCVVFCRSMYGPFVLFLSVIMLYVLLRFTDSDYAFGILNSSFIYIVVASFIGEENRSYRRKSLTNFIT